MKNLNDLIVEAIKSKLPGNTSVAKYVMSKLKVGKESAYRRMRNQVPFTFDEIALIANDLHFSIDNIVIEANAGKPDTEQTLCFSMPVSSATNGADSFIEMLNNTIAVMKELARAKELTMMVALNRIPTYYFPLPQLLKFTYCKYLHSRNEIAFNAHFTDVEVPSEIIELQQQATHYFLQLNGLSCVLEHDCFQTLIKELIYFREIGFLTQKDLISIQQELFQMLDLGAMVSSKGTLDSNLASPTFKVYYSSLPIDVNVSYYRTDNEEIAGLWLFDLTPVTVRNNPQMCQIHKRWIESRIRYASYITQSNDILRTRWYNRIRRSIEKLLDIDGDIL